MKNRMKIVPTSILLAVIALCSGCLQAFQGAADLAIGQVAPEYRATADNLFDLLTDDQLARSLEVEVMMEDTEGKLYSRDDIKFVVLTSRRSYGWDEVPRGVWERFLGETNTVNDADLQAQKDVLADLLKDIPAEGD